MNRKLIQIALVLPAMVLVGMIAATNGKDLSSQHKALPAHAAASQVDNLIVTELDKAGVKVAEKCSDDDFLRRVSLDITGQLPSPAAIAAFRADQHTDKRSTMIDKLIDSPEFGLNWARYWRDVIYIRATEQRSRINQEEFTKWMADEWNKGAGWDKTVSAMLTASGNVEEHPETGLIFAQGAMPEDVAAEACRVFLGIQLQCANCHDHPSDIWKRNQFHELTAFFPRISERRKPGEKTEFEIVSVDTDRRGGGGEFMQEHPDLFVQAYDRNRDQKLSKEELASGPKARGKKAAALKMMGEMNEMRPAKMNDKLIERLFANADTNHDGLLSIEEIKNAKRPENKKRGSLEHHMVDLKHPDQQGELIDPKFFVDGLTIKHGLTDQERRHAVAHAFTSKDNPWFAKAIVNRVWAELLGEGFYMPVDDLGPNRSARYPEAMNLLCQNFVAHGHDPKWLVRAVANTETYQRRIQSKPVAEDALPFASATPVPLRSDIVFNSLMQVFGITENEMGGRSAKAKEQKDKPRAYLQSPRFVFDALFGIDPSVPKDEITGTIPQSLMMMNSRVFRAGMAAKGDTRLNTILKEHKDDREALRELYLLVLARDPSEKELEICSQYIADVKARPEAFEDLMWSLLNSSEFISRR